MNEIRSSRFGRKSRFVSVMLSTALVSTAFSGMGGALVSSAVNAASSADYGLAENIQDGTILHCFDWTYSDIIDELPNIAQAGFTSIQTSPAQTGGGEGPWWWLYQPLGFYVSQNALGTKEELQDLCEQAESYGIKIIVDVVANHLAGDHTDIQKDLKPDIYWHTYGAVQNWNIREQVTNGEIGMPDLNTENSYVQEVVADYVQELKSIGVDGIRWDAAKHIALPSEGSTFWPSVLDSDMYNYGEILGSPGGDNGTALMNEYAYYMTVTDSGYSQVLRDAFNSGTAPTSYANWAAKGISNDRLIYWGESHDNWSNGTDSGYSNGMTQNVIDRAYAIAASRDGITALYFSRPSSKIKNSILAGQKGSTHFTADEVAAVNHFHNAMIGQTDYFVSQNNVAAVCRERGAVVVLGSGSNTAVSVKNGGSTTEPGTYIDEITGNTFTVTSTTISGTVGDTGIAVLYNEEDFLKKVKVSASPSTKTFITDTLDVKLSLKNAESGTYTTSEGASGTFTDGQTITIGANTNVAGTQKDITLTLSALDEEGQETSAEFTYVKKDPALVTLVCFDNSSYGWNNVYAYIYKSPEINSEVYFTNSLKWSNVYAYFFNIDDNSTRGQEWPGTKMTFVETNENGYDNYVIDVPDGATHVLFNNGNGTKTEDLSLSGITGYSLSGSASNAVPWSDSETETLENSSWPGVAMELNPDTGLYETNASGALANGRVIFSDGVTSTTNRYPGRNESGLAINGTSMVLGADYDWSVYAVAPVEKTELTNESTISDTEITYGNSITAVGAASGGTGSYQYAFYYKKTTDTKWVEKQAYSSNTTVSIKPGMAADYQVCIKVKDSEGTIVKKYLEFTSVSGLTNVSSISADSVEFGGTITANAASTGGTGDCTYAVLYKKTADTKWTCAQNYSSNTSVVIKPAHTTTYDVCIKVKDSTGLIVKKYFTFSVTKKAIENTSSATVSNANTILLTGSATGGSGSYKYAFYYKTGSKWIEAKAYSDVSTIEIPFEYGTYDVCIKVKDTSGTVSKAYFTLTYYYKATDSTEWIKKEGTNISLPDGTSSYHVLVKITDANGTLVEEKGFTILSATIEDIQLR